MITGGSAVQKLFDGSYEIYLKNSINLFYRYITNGHKRFSIFSRCCRKIPRRKLLFVVQNSGRQVLFNLEEISFPSLSLLSLKKILIYFQNGSLTGILVLQEIGWMKTRSNRVWKVHFPELDEYRKQNQRKTINSMKRLRWILSFTCYRRGISSTHLCLYIE